MDASDNSLFNGQRGKIFLIGFMGSGKTHWGKIWAKENSLDFFGLDEIIEQQEKETIATIFDKKGEDHFRELETAALKKFEGVKAGIISCGGGTPCYHDNMKWMNDHGTTVYLEATVQEIFDRLLNEQDSRPLVKKLKQPELHFFIDQKLKQREPFYKEARHTLNVKDLNADSIQKFIIHKA